MKFNKLKDESGSAMLLAIFLLVLVSIVIISFSSQVGNQIKSTMRADENIQEKYNMESYIEEAIADFIESINIVWKDDIVKVEDWEKIGEDGMTIKYPVDIMYIYYDLIYNNPSDITKLIDGSEEKIIEFKVSQIEPKQTNNNPMMIFSHTSPQAKELDIDEFDGTTKQIITLKLDIKEVNDNNRKDDDINSIININISNIAGSKGKEICDINYEVKSWRTK
ncbi:MAG: hypothetical protein ACRC3Y_05015 [Romboutsia sp.]|uniref:hypothetical protein n=1 Tax=Romboutsia sp. TaxID=1965302 RepID=UPI003F39203E